jgi:hypothetical protein
MVLSHRHRTHRRSSEWLPRAADRAEGFSDLFECSLFDLPNTFARQANGESGFFQRRGLRSIKSKSHAHNSDVNWVQLVQHPANFGNVIGSFQFDGGLI